jgi:hypothetical protein
MNRNCYKRDHSNSHTSEIRVFSQVLTAITEGKKPGSVDRFLIMEHQTKASYYVNEIMIASGFWPTIADRFTIIPSTLIMLLDSTAENENNLEIERIQNFARKIPQIIGDNTWDLFREKHFTPAHGIEDWLIPNTGNWKMSIGNWLIVQLAGSLPLKNGVGDGKTSQLQIELAQERSQFLFSVNLCLQTIDMEASDFSKVRPAILSSNLVKSNQVINSILRKAFLWAKENCMYRRNAWTSSNDEISISGMSPIIGVLISLRFMDIVKNSRSRHSKNIIKLAEERNNVALDSRTRHFHDLVMNKKFVGDLITNGCVGTAFSFITSFLAPLVLPANPASIDEAKSLIEILSANYDN